MLLFLIEQNYSFNRKQIKFNKKKSQITQIISQTHTKKDTKSNTLLHRAVLSEEVDIVEFLIKLNVVDINSPDENKSTPLHMAAANGNVDITKLLLSHKADIYAFDAQGETAVYIAAKRGFVIWFVMLKEYEIRGLIGLVML